MLHRFKLERQSILLLSSRGSNSSAILSEQEQKINKFSSFIDSLEAQYENITSESLEDGLEMLLRAVKMIKSPSKQNLLLKLHKFKLKLILKSPIFSKRKVEECFDECIARSQVNTIDSYEIYYGMHPQLDDLIRVKILEFCFNTSLKEKIQICFGFKRRGGRENILKDLLGNVFHELKNESCLDSDSMHLLLDFVDLCSIDEFSKQCMLIFQSNREVFLDNSQIFNKFLDLLRLDSIMQSSQLPSLITSFNSRIRSFLNRPEAKRDGIVFSCVKFVLEFYGLDILCIGQFAEYLLKFPIVKIEECCGLTRKFAYKLLALHLKNSKTSIKESRFTDLLTSPDLQFEFVQEMIERDCCDPFLLLVYTDFLNVKYGAILEKYFMLFPFASSIYTNDEDEFFVDLEDFDNDASDIDCVLEDGALLIFKDVLLPVYIKQFKCNVEGISDQFIKNLAMITGLLLGRGKVTWTDLSGTFGPNAASSSTRWEARAVYCKIYTYWLKLSEITGNIKVKIRTILNPENSAELWLKSLFDFQSGDKVIAFFNEYYGLLLTERIDCLKMLKVSAKYTWDCLVKCVDFRDGNFSDRWEYLLQIGEFLCSQNSDLSASICALFNEHLPVSNLSLIWRFYAIRENDHRIPKSHLIRYVMGDSNNLIHLLQNLRQYNGPIQFLMSIFHEFLSCDCKEKSVFVVQLFLASIPCIPSIHLLESTEKLQSVCGNLCKKGDWIQVYRSLVLLRRLKLVPKDVKFILLFLCQLNKLESFKFDLQIIEIKFRASVDYIVNIADLYYSQSITVLSSNHQVSPFNCLTELLKLLEDVIVDRDGLDLFTDYVRKQIGSSDEYFNLLFPELNYY